MPARSSRRSTKPILPSTSDRRRSARLHAQLQTRKRESPGSPDMPGSASKRRRSTRLQKRESPESTDDKPDSAMLAGVWPQIAAGLKQVYFNKTTMSRQDYMKLYTVVYNYCACFSDALDCPYGLELYNKLHHFLKKEFLEDLRRRGNELVGEDLLDFWERSWTDYTFSCKVVNGMFSYFNRYWVKREQNETQKSTVYDVDTLILLSWKNIMFLPLHNQLTPAVLSLIEKERSGEVVNTRLIKGLVDSYIEMGVWTPFGTGTHDQLQVYKEHFEQLFLEQTVHYYSKESAAFLESNPVTEYIKKVEVRLSEEERRAQIYLHDTTWDLLVQKLEEVLIKRYLGQWYEEFEVCLKDDRDDDAGRLYSLVARLPNGLDQLNKFFEAHVYQEGLVSVDKCQETADRDPKVYVEALLAVFRKYSTLVNTTPLKTGKQELGAALDKACSRFMNANAVTRSDRGTAKSAELLARYCDALLKKSAKNPDEAELEDALLEVMTIFKYIEDKDVFQTFYSKLLAKRLVQQASASDDAEVYVISKLKEACGHEYTFRLQRMYQDMSVSRGLNDKFRTCSVCKLEFSVQVLTFGSWPFSPGPQFSLPTELERVQENFAGYYRSKHQGRKLTWLHNISKGELVTSCFKNKYTLTVSTYQIAVLLQFNMATVRTLECLSEATQLKRDILEQVLHILLKCKLLMCEDSQLQPQSRIQLYEGYKNKKLRFNINVPLRSEAKKEQDDTHKTVEEDRKLIIQATIVRIMKTRKELKHQQLIGEVLVQLSARFTPAVPVVKKCIGLLIEKEYLTRARNSKDLYQYLA